jgi:signal transduction histidine kinase
VNSGLDEARLAVIAHEVRSPVAALAAIADAFASTNDHDAHRVLLRLVLRACESVERIVADVAVASIRPRRVDPAELARDVVAAAALRAIPATLEVVDPLPPIDADESRLAQALDNLVTNAFVHGGPEASVSVRAEAHGDHVRLSVSDSGPGIPTDDLDRIFDVGVRLDPRSRGMGLGLALTRAIVEGHGGTLTAVSTPGESATFTIELPAWRPQPATRASTS